MHVAMNREMLLTLLIWVKSVISMKKNATTFINYVFNF